MRGGRIDPSSCLDTCWVDDMAVWWFRATCFHGLKYLCVNREVLKQNFIMRPEMKVSSECLYPTDVFLISCGMDASESPSVTLPIGDKYREDLKSSFHFWGSRYFK